MYVFTLFLLAFSDPVQYSCTTANRGQTKNTYFDQTFTINTSKGSTFKSLRVFHSFDLL